jgi:hypothetical protein
MPSEANDDNTIDAAPPSVGSRRYSVYYSLLVTYLRSVHPDKSPDRIEGLARQELRKASLEICGGDETKLDADGYPSDTKLFRILEGRSDEIIVLIRRDQVTLIRREMGLKVKKESNAGNLEDNIIVRNPLIEALLQPFYDFCARHNLQTGQFCETRKDLRPDLKIKYEANLLILEIIKHLILIIGPSTYNRVRRKLKHYSFFSHNADTLLTKTAEEIMDLLLNKCTRRWIKSYLEEIVLLADNPDLVKKIIKAKDDPGMLPREFSAKRYALRFASKSAKEIPVAPGVEPNIVEYLAANISRDMRDLLADPVVEKIIDADMRKELLCQVMEADDDAVAMLVVCKLMSEINSLSSSFKRLPAAAKSGNSSEEIALDDAIRNGSFGLYRYTESHTRRYSHLNTDEDRNLSFHFRYSREKPYHIQVRTCTIERKGNAPKLTRQLADWLPATDAGIEELVALGDKRLDAAYLLEIFSGAYSASFAALNSDERLYFASMIKSLHEILLKVRPLTGN